MGKVLRPEHITFFTARMDEHSRVINWSLVADDHEYLFRINRVSPGSRNDVIVHLTDAYRYGLADFYARPDQLGVGSYIVIGMPHASADREVIKLAKQSGIGIGHIGKFMGALNYKNIWEYVSPDEKREREALRMRRQSARQVRS